MGKVLRNFCWHQNFVPKGLSVPALGLYKCIKPFKMCFKSYFKRDCFKTCNKWAKWQGLSVDINICPQGFFCPCPGAIYMYESIKIYTRTRCQVSIYRTTGPVVSYICIHRRLLRDCRCADLPEYSLVGYVIHVHVVPFLMNWLK